MATEIADPRGNRLLASLSGADRTHLAPFLKTVALKQGLVLNEPGDEIGNIYFPCTGVISLLAVMKDGKAIETATVGREGAVGAMTGLCSHVTLTRIVVQVPVVAAQITTLSFHKVIHASDAIRDLVVRYNEALFGQVQMTAACNALHPIHSRLARWVLQMRDRVDDNNFPLTQELLSEMLGVRRSSVSEVAGKLQEAGIIHYSRGVVQVVDRPALEELACECYQTIKQQIEQVLR